MGRRHNQPALCPDPEAAMIRSYFGIVAIAAIACVSGCGEDKKAQTSGKLTIAIGSVAPLTGGIAHLGKDNENGARLAVEEANAAGIRIDGKEPLFQLLAADAHKDAKPPNTIPHNHLYA